MSVAVLKRWRNAITAFIAHLDAKMKDLEAMKPNPISLCLAQGMEHHKIGSLDAEFHGQHYKIVDLKDETDEDTPLAEQHVLYTCDDVVASINARLKVIINSCSLPSSTPGTDLLVIMTHKLACLEKHVTSTQNTVTSLPPTSDACLLQQYEEQLRDVSAEIGRISDHPGIR